MTFIHRRIGRRGVSVAALALVAAIVPVHAALADASGCTIYGTAGADLFVGGDGDDTDEVLPEDTLKNC